ncbi:MAG: translation initiation factor IF-2 [Deltaproteobacteria bacterium]|nr:translation initiation factor IF-2 [Deltaproteobacteria bacterium]
MPKTRVYELAKELGIESKEFLDRLIAAGIDVSSHMSAIEEKDVERVRKEFGDNEPEVVEEKRVADRIIRRRRKAVVTSPPSGAETMPSEGEVEIPEPPEFQTEEGPAIPLAMPAEGGVPEPPSEPAVPTAPYVEKISAGEVEIAGEKSREAAEKAPAPTMEAVTPVEEAERISDEPEAKAGSPAGGIESERPTEAEPEPKFVETTEAETVPAIEPVMEEPLHADRKQGAELVEMRERTRVGQVEQVGEEVEAAEIVEGEALKPKAKPKPKAKKPKKKRKETPARIIRMPEPVEIAAERPPEQAAVKERAVSGDLGAAEKPPEIPLETAPAEAKPGRKKKGRRGFKAEEVELEAPKKAVKRREIVERDELYDLSQAKGRTKKQKPAVRKSKKTTITVPKAIKRRIRMGESIMVAELAKKMGIKAAELLRKLLSMGVMANINQAVDFDAAALVSADFGYEVERQANVEDRLEIIVETKEENLEPRPPVITVMGHVDHGKTSLLDYIRKSNVTEGEAGGITQHIGAYKVTLDSGDVVFLDTPGHEAFTGMRARGAKITDLVILVVAADEGMKQQTKEAIDHARAGEVPIVVAVNKIDKPGADPDRVKRELAEYNLMPEEWGGDTMFVPVSAKTGEGIDALLENVLLQAEVLELKADPSAKAKGTIIESRLDKGRGAVATVLVQSGTLRVGDAFVCGKQAGRVRAMMDDQSRTVKEAGPSTPIEVQGLSGVPNAGDEFVVVDDEKTARLISEHRQDEIRQSLLPQSGAMTLEKLYQQIQEGEIKELNVVLKGDVHGSVEAIVDALHNLDTRVVTVQIIHASTGAVTESDVMLAAASNAIIVGFNVRPTNKARDQAEQEGVEIRFYNVIYELLDDIRDAMVGLLEPTYEEKTLGQAVVREVFHITKLGTVAGCYVTSGKIIRGSKIRVLRNGVVVFNGDIGSLRRYKEDAKEVAQGLECGINVVNFNDIKIDDVMESYILVEVQPTLE